MPTKSRHTLTVALATYNEAENISRCLKGVEDLAHEIIIVDGQSTDDTIKIAQSFPKVKIISTTNKPLFHLNKQMAIDAAQGDWVLQLDADEVVTPKLKQEIKHILDQPLELVKDNGFWINRQNYFLGRFLTKGGTYPDATIRFYKRGKGKLPCISVHEQAQVEGSVGHLSQNLLHFADPSFSRYLLRNNRYTTLMAKELQETKLPLNLLSLISFLLFKPTFRFCQIYFRHKGFVDGFPGFVFALFSALSLPTAFIKYWEMSHQKNINIEHDWR
jgi:glycosyltransferase involved in cell wall biosynthesis